MANCWPTCLKTERIKEEKLMDSNKLSEIIREHKKWLTGDGGQRANMRGANMQRANMRGANMQGANMRGADMRGADMRDANMRGADMQSANMQSADMQGANMRGANMRGADMQGTILDGINWLAYIGIVPNKSGTAYAYKVTTANGTGIAYSGIDYLNNDKFEEAVDTDVYTHCSHGINLATFSWCLNSFTDKSYRLFMFKFNVKDAVCPVASDGKFRVSKCTKVGECDWTGNLKN